MPDPGAARGDHSRAARLFVMLLAVAMCGCAPLDPPSLAPGEDAIDLVHRGSFASADAASRSATLLPAPAHHRRWFPWFFPRPIPRRLPNVPLIDDALLRRIAAPIPGARETLFITFNDSLRIQPFGYWPVPGTKRDSAFGLTADSLILTATGRIQLLAAQRAARYTADSLDLTNNYGATILKKYWLIQAFLVEMPLASVDTLSKRPGLLYIRPNRGNPPPNDPIPGNDAGVAAANVGTRHYRDDLGLEGEWTALLDTGVRTQHELLCGEDGSSRVCLMADAITGDGMATSNFTCNILPGCDAQAGEDYTENGHGTASAAILVGNNRLGDRYRGVTNTSLDCIRVYDSSQLSSTDAAVSAYEIATRRLDRVMAVEMQERTLGDIAVATRNAYDAGIAIIAANGNDAAYVSTSPATERLAIGVGAYDVEDEIPDASLSAGITADGRNKPDVIAPTNTETAAYDPTNSSYKVGIFPGTSGATPYIAGAASLISGWLRIGPQPARDAGQVYSVLMMSGDQPGPFSAATRYGTGRTKLPPSGEAVFGKTWVSFNAPTVDIPIVIDNTSANPVTRIDAAIWWPELTEMQGNVPIDTHSDVDVSLHEPGLFGGRVAASNGIGGVFEKISYENTAGIQSGKWKLRIHGYSILRPPQIVYWSLRLKHGASVAIP